MKLLSEFRRHGIEEKVVHQAMMKGSKVVVTKGSRGFKVSIDGDDLDTYKDRDTAVQAAKEFIQNAG
jgi:hypothetical protein